MDEVSFLPYQLRWLRDKSPIKIWEKSRRIGATYVQAFEDVYDCAEGRVPAVWFSSADESAAKEYILYCEEWARLIDGAIQESGERLIGSDKDIKAFCIEFTNGTRINALSSNPKGFRSKGGKVVLDEFGWHDNQDAMWAAARPCTTWGFPLRILSTHNGKACKYYKFIEAVRSGKLDWSLHTTDIHTAAQEGLIDKILRKKTTAEEKEKWLDDERESCLDDDIWQQEYNCVPVDSSTAFLPYDLITPCELDGILQPLGEIQGDLFLGADIGRKKDLTVFWGIEKIENIHYTRFITILERCPFKIQREALFNILGHRKLRRACVDATGIGMQLAEEAQEAYGKYKVEAVTATNQSNNALAYAFKTEFENRTIFIPPDSKLRDDLHSIQKVTTQSGNIKFATAAGHRESHADRFWAGALAVNASKGNPGPVHVASRKRRKARELMEGY